MPFTEEEVGHYRQMAAMVFNNDPRKKTRIDELAKAQLATVKAALPGADDDTVVTFLVSVAIVSARVLSTPLSDVADLVRGVFDNNIIAAAAVMGAYDFDNPDVPVYEEPKPEADPAADAVAEALDKIIGRQYL